MIKSNLKEIADNKGLSIRKIARDIDYRFASVHSLYNDDMERFPRELLSKLCIYLNVTIDQLLIIDKE